MIISVFCVAIFWSYSFSSLFFPDYLPSNKPIFVPLLKHPIKSSFAAHVFSCGHSLKYGDLSRAPLLRKTDSLSSRSHLYENSSSVRGGCSSSLPLSFMESCLAGLIQVLYVLSQTLWFRMCYCMLYLKTCYMPS